nr:hypothetical protein [Bacillus velezensis]
MIPLDPDIETTLGATDYINATYRAPDSAATVNVFAACMRHKPTGQVSIRQRSVCPWVGGKSFRLTPTPYRCRPRSTRISKSIGP